MVDNVTIERFTGGSWVEVANVTLAGDASSGISTATRTAYGINYAIDHLDRRDAAALSAAVPVSLDTLRSDRWPAFLVDLIPQGFGRAELLRRLGLPEDMGGQADWQLLLAGAGNPIGHLRVREAHEWLQEHRTLQPSSGFTFEEVAAGGDGFIETLGRNGMFVAGSSGVQGEWPKLLLTEDATGRLHLDHMLPDPEARAHWLVKFGRGQDAGLTRILELEAPYMRLAQRLGARVHGELRRIHRTLFIPRFDRKVVPAGVERVAQESIASLCEIARFGVTEPHDRVVARLAAVATDPQTEIIEYVRRDVLNVVLGNRDNHSRNTALHRCEDGTIRLSPLFDFVPMVYYPDPMPRQSRWTNEHGPGPDWRRVVEQCREASGLNLPDLPDALRQLGALLERLPEHAEQAGVPAGVIDRQRHSIAHVRESLATVQE